MMSREMKDSGVAWIGEIPKGWRISNVGKFFHIVLGKMLQPNRINENDTLEKYLCAANVGKNTLSLNEIKEMWFTEKEKEQYALQKGDLLVVEGGDVASSAIISINVTNIYIQNALHRVRAKFNDDIRFLRYMLTASKAVGHIDLICNKATIAHFTKDKFSKLTYLIPPPTEQQSIANYLDEKCAEIDNLISLLEEMIGELKAYKQSVITEAVCKGLNKNIPMKDSGIEWIGEIPKNWELKKLKNIINSTLSYGANESGVAFDDSLPRYVRITDILDNRLREDIPKLSLTEKQANGFILEDKDILFARSGGTVGKTFMYRQHYGRCAFAGYLIKASVNNTCSADFIYYFTLSNAYDEWKSQVFIQSTIQNIGANKYVLLEIPIPPLSEQQTIANYLDEKCGNIEGLIAIKQAKIDELKEFKKSLIYEYVTGKKSVI